MASPLAKGGVRGVKPLKLPALILSVNINRKYLTEPVRVEKRSYSFQDKMVELFPTILSAMGQDNNKEEVFYTVSWQNTVNWMDYALELKIKETEEKIEKYLAEDFQNTIAYCFDKIDNYLDNYRDTLKQAMSEKSSSLKTQVELQQILDSFAKNAELLLTKTAKKLEFTQQIISR